MMLTKRRPHPTVHAFFASRLTYLPECFIVRHPGPCHCQARIARLSRQTPAGNLRQSDCFRSKDCVGNLLRIRKFEGQKMVDVKIAPDVPLQEPLVRLGSEAAK